MWLTIFKLLLNDQYLSTLILTFQQLTTNTLDDFFYKEDSDVWRPNGANSSDAYVSLWQVFKIDKVQDHKWTQMGAQRQQHRNQFK